MNNIIIKNIVRFLLLVAFQVLLLNKMNFLGFIIPFVYVLFIILLPLRTNKLLLLFLAFIIGFTIDFFGSTPGLHSSATVLLAFFRPGVLKLFFGNIEFVQDEEPNISKLGFFGFFRYALLLVVIHHFALFMLETLSFSKLLMVLKTTLLSSIATMLLIYIYVFLFTKRGR